MISVEEVKQVLREVYKRQGFIVIGQPAHAETKMQLGDTTHHIFQYDIGSPFLLSDRATQSDWNKQNELVARLRPSWSRLPAQIGGQFFKITPVTADGKRRLSA